MKGFGFVGDLKLCSSPTNFPVQIQRKKGGNLGMMLVRDNCSEAPASPNQPGGPEVPSTAISATTGAVEEADPTPHHQRGSLGTL